MRTSDVGSRFRQDIINLSWNEKELLKMLAKRIEVFDGDTTGQMSLFGDEEQGAQAEYASLEKTISRYFDPFDASFAENKRTDYRALLTFSLSRPRWVIEFCSLALAYDANNSRASIKDFKRAAAEFGRNRIIFLAGEHGHHFPDLEQVITQFASARKFQLGNNLALRELILKTVIHAGVRTVRKDGLHEDVIASLEEIAALKVANDLFMIEFIRAKQFAGGKDNHRFHTYATYPSLLSSWNSDKSILWEIHPMFARSLNIIDSGTYHTGGKDRLFGDRKKREK